MSIDLPPYPKWFPYTLPYVLSVPVLYGPYSFFVGHWRRSVTRHLEWLLTPPSGLYKLIWNILKPFHSFRIMCHQPEAIPYHLETPKSRRTLITTRLPNQKRMENILIKKVMDVPLVLQSENVWLLKGLTLNRTLERRNHLRRAVFILLVNLLLPIRRLKKTALLGS